MRWAVLFAAWLLGAQTFAAQTPVPGISVAEQYLYTQANAERTHRGLGALRWDPALYQAASFHAREMAAHGGISHQFPGEPELTERGRSAGARFSVIAENVAEASTAVRVHEAWMNSPGHRANLLDPRLDAVGIRVERRGGQLYAVQDFGREVASLSLQQQEETVAALLQAAAGNVSILAPSPDARKTCSLDTGFAGGRRPGFVMRYSTDDVGKLPESLRSKLASGRYRQAAVGACTSREPGFTAFAIAVLLYP